MNILAFSGRKQSGKSTSAEYVANFVKQSYPDKICKIYSFADPLKIDICMNLFGLSYQQCYGSDDDKNSLTDLLWENMPDYVHHKNINNNLSGLMTAREVMEFIGTNVFRKIKNNIWVDATIRKIKAESPDLAIIPDCRFPNEVNTLIENNGYVIRLTLDPFFSQSNSETALDKDKYDWNKFSLVVDNANTDIDSKNEIITRHLQHKGILPL